MAEMQDEINDRLESIKKVTQGFKVNLEGNNVKLEEVKNCLSEMTDILELLSKTIVISDQMDLSYRHRILQDLELLKKNKELLEKLTASLYSENPAIYKKIEEFVSSNNILLKTDLQDSLKYLRKLNCEDASGRPLTGLDWLKYHLSKGSQAALAGIIVASIYYFLRYVLPHIMNWAPR